MDEKEPGKFRIGPAHRQKPRRRQGKKQQDPRQREPPAEVLPSAGEHDPPEDHRSGKHHADEPLGQGGQRRSAVKEGEPPPGTPHPQEEPHEGQGQEKRQRHVCDVDVRRGEPQQRAPQHRPRRESRPGAPEPGAEERHETGAPQRPQGRHEAGGEFRFPQQLKGSGGEPVVQRGLLEIFDVVQPGSGPISRLPHLPGDLPVPPLVGLQQAVISQTPEVEHPQGQQKRPQARQKVALVRKPHRRDLPRSPQRPFPCRATAGPDR